jgi:hypothetical protein
VESGLYSYRSFVEFVLRNSLEAETRVSAPQSNVWDSLFFHFMRLMEALSWLKVALFRFILKMTPGRFLEWLKALRRGLPRFSWEKLFTQMTARK